MNLRKIKESLIVMIQNLMTINIQLNSIVSCCANQQS